jgi:hypothetical protein
MILGLVMPGPQAASTHELEAPDNQAQHFSGHCSSSFISDSYPVRSRPRASFLYVTYVKSQEREIRLDDRRSQLVDNFLKRRSSDRVLNCYSPLTDRFDSIHPVLTSPDSSAIADTYVHLTCQAHNHQRSPSLALSARGTMQAVRSLP